MGLEKVTKLNKKYGLVLYNAIYSVWATLEKNNKYLKLGLGWVRVGVGLGSDLGFKNIFKIHFQDGQTVGRRSTLTIIPSTVFL